jgi:hypothetical protein
LICPWNSHQSNHQPHNPKFSSHQTTYSPLFAQGKPIFTTTLLSTASTPFSTKSSTQIHHLFLSLSVQIPALLASSPRSSLYPIHCTLIVPMLSAVCSAKPNLYRPILLKIHRARSVPVQKNPSLMRFAPSNPIFAALF